MTNDIRKIKEKYLRENKKVINTIKYNKKNDYSDGMLVVDLKTEKQMTIGEITEDGKYKCYSNYVYVGDFDSSELMEFNQWLKETYKK